MERTTNDRGFDDQMWRAAASLASRFHDHQYRRDGVTPYVAHCFRVAMTVRDVFECDDPVALAAALVHDVIEDTPGDFDDIEEATSIQVARAAAAVTKNMSLREAEREIAYDAQIAAGPWQGRLIKLADVMDNLADAIADSLADGGPILAGARLDKHLDRMRRALALAKGDTSGQPAIARAIAVVQGVLDRHSGNEVA